MLFEVAGERLIWTLRGPEIKSATLDRAFALRTLMLDYRRFFERMQILNPHGNNDYDVALAYMLSHPLIFEKLSIINGLHEFPLSPNLLISLIFSKMRGWLRPICGTPRTCDVALG